jgi:hypothetical protein
MFLQLVRSLADFDFPAWRSSLKANVRPLSGYRLSGVFVSSTAGEITDLVPIEIRVFSN